MGSPAIRVIPLTVTSCYASSWGTWEGVRELIQNWFDGLHSMVEAMDDLPLGAHVGVEFREVKDNMHELKFDAFIQNPNSETEIILGKLIYHKFESRLKLINHCTALQKKILLLGYSAKADTKEVIGQFGEGLKIGALALVRLGHMVSMETGSDIWEFQLLHNEEFGEKVLSVVITERIPDMEDQKDSSSHIAVKESSHTCTTVSGLMWEDWKKFLPRFLFLKPPAECVKTELGTLLLDPALAGQMYMKGIWVSDLSGEDLAAGADFMHLKLDRDRNAVPKPSEIDHQVSGMWVRAVEKEPKLAVQYFKLLQDDKYRDIRHAAQYASEDTALLIAEQFLRQYGRDGFPVLNSSSSEDIMAVRDELQKTVVLCSTTLFSILSQSGKYESLSKVLSQHRSNCLRLVPFTNLEEWQKNILREASELIKMVDTEFSIASIDVIITSQREFCSTKGSRVLVPSWMFELTAVHEEINLSDISSVVHPQCKCCESVICLSVLEAIKYRLAHAVPRHVQVTGLSPIPVPVHPLLFVVSGLASQMCQNVQRFYCYEIHKTTSTCKDEKSAKENQQREEAYLKRIAELEAELENECQTKAEALLVIEGKLKAVEKELFQKEISLVNDEAALQARFDQQIKAFKESAETTISNLKKTNKELKCQIVNMKQDLMYQETSVQDLRQQLQQTVESYEKKNSVLLEELSHYVTQCRHRTINLSKLSKEICGSEDDQSREKWKLIGTLCDLIVQDLQSEKFICAVCKIKRKSRLLQPCGHFVLCEDCSDQFLQDGWCPVCKQDVGSQLQVFE